VSVAAEAPPSAAHDVEYFEQHIRPVLAGACGECHGPEVQEGDLRLDSREALLRGGASGPAATPGSVEESLIVQAIRRSGDLQMPPDRPLEPPAIAAIEHWIALGAPWPAGDPPPVDDREAQQRSHWAFQPIGAPSAPQVQQTAWIRTPVDAFIRAKLESAGLAPSAPADRRTLIRRVTYDLTGLPPTQDEVDAFLSDSDPEAYAHLVERLLASPHYGEHWARHWLDVARYSDTKGYVYAREERFFVHAWSYRDWVVAALNSDMPYDRFIMLQLAADQAAPDDPAALAAMGYLTLGRRFLGVTHDIIDDRIDAVTRGMLGLTVACARCHDHKYDPIPTADYYSLYGVFRNCAERPVAIGPSPSTGDARAAFEAELAARQQRLAEATASSRAEASARARGRAADYLLAQLELEKYPEEDFNQVYSKDDVIPEFVRRWQAYLTIAAELQDPVFEPWRRFAALDAANFAQQAAAIAAEITRQSGEAVNSRIAKALVEPPSSMADVAQRYGQVFAEVDAEWQELSKNPGAAALPDAAAEEIRKVLYGPRSPCEIPDEGIVGTEQFFDTPTIENLWKLQGEVDRWLVQSPEAPPYAVALVDRAWLTEPRVFRRGNPAAKGERVPRQFLKALSGPDRKPFEHGSGRLEMAQAIVSPDNPLTARVWANRIWMHHFGAGLVTTPSDFGLRSAPPSHPELLDWLARQLIEGGWSTKALHRAIVLSATYQQASAEPSNAVAHHGADEVDPENRLLWRMNERRLTFEEWRDTLLSVSGELDPKLGGRPSPLLASGAENCRRTLYGLVDRQFLTSAFRMFDFANPDLHTPQRSETTVSQQALFSLNHPFVANRARALAASVASGASVDVADRVRRLFASVYQRQPTEVQLQSALEFLSQSDDAPAVRPEARDWQYGFGEISAKADAVAFSPLPHFTGGAWQGGAEWPDAALGWVQLTAEGGHAGNDLQHASVRRWTAPITGVVDIESTISHQAPAGDGVRCWIISSRQGLLLSSVIHHRTQRLSVESLQVEAGDAVDFIVDFHADLNSDDFRWKATINEAAGTAGDSNAAGERRSWDSARDFAGPVPRLLDKWQQLAQVLLLSNELMFVD
jgi:hypothetical protein